MKNKLEWYLKKYGTIESLNRSATQSEKEEFFLIKRAVEVSYDDHFLQNQHNLDNLINKYIEENKRNLSIYQFGIEHSCFSLYSNRDFSGLTNLYNPPSFSDEIPEKVEFKSMYQFIVFHKAILFLDRKSALEILSTFDFNKLMKLNSNISNVDKGVWSKYRISIAALVVQSMLENHFECREYLLKLEHNILVFVDADKYWGVEPDKIKHSEINSIDFYRNNYLGKLLTKYRLENIKASN